MIKFEVEEAQSMKKERKEWKLMVKCHGKENM